MSQDSSQLPEGDHYVRVRMGEFYIELPLSTEGEVRNVLRAENWTEVGAHFRFALMRWDTCAGAAGEVNV